MAIKLPQNQEITEGGKNEAREKVGSGICRKRTNRGA